MLIGRLVFPRGHHKRHEIHHSWPLPSVFSPTRSLHRNRQFDAGCHLRCNHNLHAAPHGSQVSRKLYLWAADSDRFSAGYSWHLERRHRHADRPTHGHWSLFVRASEMLCSGYWVKASPNDPRNDEGVWWKKKWVNTSWVARVRFVLNEKVELKKILRLLVLNDSWWVSANFVIIQNANLINICLSVEI